MMKSRINLEVIVSACAIITSVVALFIAIKQTELMQNQQDASVWPIVTSDITINQNDEVSYIHFELANVGVGPAIIREGNLFINDTVVSDYQVIQENLLVGALKDAVSMETSSMTGVVGAGKEKAVLKLSWERSQENDASFVKTVEQFVQNGTKLRMAYCYCSVFERCYQSGMGKKEGPKQVDSCNIQTTDPMSRILESAQQN